MNIGICGLILATMAVRFIYPSLSLEGDSFWILGSSPVSAATLFREKFLSSFVVFLIFTEGIGIVSVWLLALEDIYRILTFWVIFLMSITLSSIAVGLGAMFPDFSERNPSKIVSSPGGILTVAVSLVYVAVMMAIIAVPAYRYTIYLVSGGVFPRTELIVSVVLAIILNFILIVVPLRLGANAFTKREF
jgi:ABC-2 type transport system permease protein